MNNFDFSFDGMGGLLGSFVVPSWDKEWTVYTADEENSKWYAFGPDHTYQFQAALDKAKAMIKMIICLSLLQKNFLQIKMAMLLV